MAVLSTSSNAQGANPAIGGRVSSDVSSPVPLPAPNPHSNKHEPRSTGVLVHHWAVRAGIPMLEVAPALPGANVAPQTTKERVSGEEDRSKRQSNRGRRNSQSVTSGSAGTGGGSGSGLVERPPAVMAMMEMVSQPSKVVRVLARGEKLDPDP